MRVLDVSKHDIALVKTIFTKATLHELQVSQFICIASVRLRKHALIEHLLIDFEELLLAAVNVNQGRYDIVLTTLRGDELDRLAL